MLNRFWVHNKQFIFGILVGMVLLGLFLLIRFERDFARDYQYRGKQIDSIIQYLNSHPIK